MTLKITDAQAAELAASFEYAENVTPRQAASTRRKLIAALPDLLADRAALLDALRRAETALNLAYRSLCGSDRELELPVYAPIPAALADLRALLASAEGERDG